MTRRHYLGLLATIAAANLVAPSCLCQRDQHMLRIAVSIETLGGANIKDARAAYSRWTGEVLRNLSTIHAEMDPEIFLLSEQMLQGIRQGGIDCYGIAALEYAKVVELTYPNGVLIQDFVGGGIEYLLLVHKDSPFKTLGELRGAQIATHHHRDMILAPAWLATLLAANNLPPTERFFGGQMTPFSLNQVILPVFFRRLDAACVTRPSWDTAVEMNPQLGRSLRPLAVSPKIVPNVLCFRRNINAEDRLALLNAILNMTSQPGGRQITELYQAHAFVERTSAVMKSSVDMVFQYERLEANRQKGRP